VRDDEAGERAGGRTHQGTRGSARSGQVRRRRRRRRRMMMMMMMGVGMTVVMVDDGCDDDGYLNPPCA
jgi:hypothetical protein